MSWQLRLLFLFAALALLGGYLGQAQQSAQLEARVAAAGGRS